MKYKHLPAEWASIEDQRGDTSGGQFVDGFYKEDRRDTQRSNEGMKTHRADKAGKYMRNDVDIAFDRRQAQEALKKMGNAVQNSKKAAKK